MDSQDYIEVKVTVGSEDEGDVVVALVSDLGYDSFYYEDGIQSCYIPTDSFDEAALAEALGGCAVGGAEGGAVDGALGGSAGGAGGIFSYTWAPMPKVNWNSQWEAEGFTPIRCGEYVILPAGAEVPAGFKPIFLNPQMAFGTGHHQTTFMMMESMQALSEEICCRRVVDLGCGTAVLGILAAKLGASSVTGIDIDAVAVRSAAENVALNGLDFPVICGDASALCGGAADDGADDGADGCATDGDCRPCCDVLLANIHKNIIIGDISRYAAALSDGGYLLVSGFYDSDLPDVLDAACGCGFTLGITRCREGWCCAVFQKGGE